MFICFLSIQIGTCMLPPPP